MDAKRVITLEEGWPYIESGITKLKRILEGEPEPQFESEQYMNLYTLSYNMCSQGHPYDYAQQLYDRHRKAIEDYCKQTVLTSLREKHGENMLKELAVRWSNHKVVVKWFSRIFQHIDRYYVALRHLPKLNEVGLKCFRDLVYNEMQSKATEAVIAFIQNERDGEEIDRAVLKNVLEMFVEIEMGYMDKYVEDFEIFMLQDTTAYYSRMASSWIHEYSCHEFMLKYEECLQKERERVTHYLHISTEPKLVKALKEEFEIFSNKIVAGSSTEDLMARMTI